MISVVSWYQINILINFKIIFKETAYYLELNYITLGCLAATSCQPSRGVRHLKQSPWSRLLLIIYIFSRFCPPS